SLASPMPDVARRHPHSLYAPAPTEISALSLHDALPISAGPELRPLHRQPAGLHGKAGREPGVLIPRGGRGGVRSAIILPRNHRPERKSTRLNSSHVKISYAVACLKQKSRTGSPTSQQ